jgi:DNA-binding NtrC family response regulator
VDLQSLNGSETILVVEDEAQILRLCKRVLESKGYTIIAADNPEEAIALVEKNADEIQMLITDFMLPSMNGEELYEGIRALKPDIGVLYMSGFTVDVIAHQEGASEKLQFIQKPFSPRDLTRKVREVLDKTPCSDAHTFS